MALQNPDGGWSWCPEMESSAFMTSNVLLHFGMLKQNGYLGDARLLENALSKGRKYLDSETLSEYVRDKNVSVPQKPLNGCMCAVSIPKPLMARK